MRGHMWLNKVASVLGPLMSEHVLLRTRGPKNFTVYYSDGEEFGNTKMESMIENDLDECLEAHCNEHLNKTEEIDGEMSELNETLIEYLISHCERAEDGRLQMPLLWNGKVAHLLGQNYHLVVRALARFIQPKR